MRNAKVLFWVSAMLMIFVVPALAEDYTNILYLMDAFYANDADPWSLKKSELPVINNLKGFDCRHLVTSDDDRQLQCTSVKGSYTGTYQITLSFGSDNDLVLDAVEIIVSHPTLNTAYSRHESINYYLRSFTDEIKKKAYIAPTLVETDMEYIPEAIHTIIEKGTTYYDVFRFGDSAVSVGSVEDRIVLNFSSYYYYAYNCYVEQTDETTGETVYILTWPN